MQAEPATIFGELAARSNHLVEESRLVLKTYPRVARPAYCAGTSTLIPPAHPRSARAYSDLQRFTTKNGTIMSVNSFRPRKFEEHEIVDGQNKVVGHVRVKPSGILWSPKNRKDWFGVSLDAFAEFMEANGKKQSK